MYSAWRLVSMGPVLLRKNHGMRLYFHPNLDGSNMNPKTYQQYEFGKYGQSGRNAQRENLIRTD